MIALHVLFRSAVFAAAFAVAPAFAQAPQLPTPDEPIAPIVVTGEGSVNIAPDYALVSAGVVTRAKTAGEAADANAALMTTVIGSLTNAGIDRNDIQTAQFSLQPVYAAPQPGNEQKITGFSVSNRLNVKIRNLGKAGAVLDGLVTAGANDLGNIQYLHSNPSQILDQARETAVADARRKAELYARTAGLRLGRVVFITEDTGSASPPPYGPMFRTAAPMAPASTQVLSGEDTLRVRIVVGFDVAR